MPDQNKHPLICNIDLDICEAADDQNISQFDTLQERPVKIIYFTDPICSSCWGIEPQLRKLKLTYGSSLEIEYRMGGLLPDWSYNSGGISSPLDVAHHWDEVSIHYDMPIDGDVWIEDPLDSSYPPSIAFKAAQMQDGKLALEYLRRIREMVFLEKKNITKWKYLSQAANEVGLDVEKLKTDYSGKAKALFEGDLALARQLGVRGFPTMYFRNADGIEVKVYGSKPYEAYVQAIQATFPEVEAFDFTKTPETLFKAYSGWTRREFAEVSGITISQSEGTLNELEEQGKLRSTITKNGKLWYKSDPIR